MPATALIGRVLINREYAKLWLGELVSVTGDAIFDTTLLLWVGTRIAHGQSWAPLAASGVLLAAAVPALIAGPIAGVFVDRWDHRRTMLVADALRAVVIALLLVVALAPAGSLSVPAQLAAVYLAVGLVGIVSQFFNPARFAIVGDLVGPAARARASSIGQATWAVATIAGPPLAAPLLIGFGVRWALIINAASFVISFLAIRAIRVPAIPIATASASAPAGESVTPDAAADAAKPAFFRELTAGLRFFLGDRVLVVILGTVFLITMGAGALTALDVFFIPANLHASATWLGTLSTALGAGSVLGAVLGGAFAPKIGLSRTYAWCLLACGLGFLAYSRTTSIWPALGLLFVVGIPVAGINCVVGPIILRVTPREFVGRVLSVLNPAQQLASLVSVALAGWLASTVLRGLDTTVAGVHLGPYDTIFGVGGVLILGAALWAFVAFRGTDAAARALEQSAEAGGHAAVPAPAASPEDQPVALPELAPAPLAEPPASGV